MNFSTEITENYFVELETQFMSSSVHSLYQWPFYVKVYWLLLYWSRIFMEYLSTRRTLIRTVSANNCMQPFKLLEFEFAAIFYFVWAGNFLSFSASQMLMTNCLARNLARDQVLSYLKHSISIKNKDSHLSNNKPDLVMFLWLVIRSWSRGVSFCLVTWFVFSDQVSFLTIRVFHSWPHCVPFLTMCCFIPDHVMFHSWPCDVSFLTMWCFIPDHVMFHSWSCDVSFLTTFCSILDHVLFHSWPCSVHSWTCDVHSWPCGVSFLTILVFHSWPHCVPFLTMCCLILDHVMFHSWPSTWCLIPDLVVFHSWPTGVFHSCPHCVPFLIMWCFVPDHVLFLSWWLCFIPDDEMFHSCWWDVSFLTTYCLAYTV